MAPTSRSCLRCIAKKRKCDHAYPCALCVKADADCEYPPDQQRRGPIAGYTKILEKRMYDLEAALAFVIGIEGVQQVLRATLSDSTAEIAHNHAWSTLSREDRIDLILSRPLRTVHDLLAYTEGPLGTTSSTLRFRNELARSSHRRSASPAETSVRMAERPESSSLPERSSRAALDQYDAEPPGGSRPLGALRRSAPTRTADELQKDITSSHPHGTGQRHDQSDGLRTDSIAPQHGNVLHAMRDGASSPMLPERAGWLVSGLPNELEPVPASSPDARTPIPPRPTPNDIFW